MLKANGARVIATDLAYDRVTLAKQLGADAAFHPDDDAIEQVVRVTDGVGADGVIIAATPSDAVISTAFKMCRRKGACGAGGRCRLAPQPRRLLQQGARLLYLYLVWPRTRYDNRYEEQGYDYPVAYVRWTENRNMSEYLRMLSEGKIDLKPLNPKVFPVEQATAAYDSLKGEDRPLMVVLQYPTTGAVSRTIHSHKGAAAGEGRVRLAIVGAGDFAKGMHLPNLKASERYQLAAVMSRTGHNAAMVAKTFNMPLATTDYAEVLNNANIDAVLISTRHNLHASMTLEALKAGKHVLVEKPLALTDAEVREIEQFYAENSKAPQVLTGFNRRFSPYALKLHELTRERTNPMILNYRMNAGYIPLTHWTHGEEGGGRNLGEACHIYDLFTYLVNSKVTRVTAQHIRPTTGYYSAQDNFVATIGFEDGSLATLTYTALGSKEYPKEQMEVFSEGRVYVMSDYKKLEVVGAKVPVLETPLQDKGHKTEVETFARTIQDGGEWAIPLWQQIQATDIALRVEGFLTAAEKSSEQ
ncbi:MAG: Gfo/Idh/MocA family oxidoreductase [Anaerolineae bacterium]